MTAAVQARSAYPATVEELLPQARALVADLGEVPSRNRLKRELRVGAPKAAAVRDALLTAERDRQIGMGTRADDLIRGGPARGSVPAVDPVGRVLPKAPIVEPVPEQPRAADREVVTSNPAGQAVAPVPDSTPAVGRSGGPAASTPVSQVGAVVDPGTNIAVGVRPVRSWPVLLLALPAFVAIWSGWVGLGGLTGFGIVHPLPGIADRFSINSAITLPFGVETYAAYALRAWLSPGARPAARRFARWSAIGSLVLGALGQVAYHLLVAAHVDRAPAWITTLVACLPVAVLGMGAALAHLLRADRHH